jgi:predicted lipid carrier protein YhbT
MSEATEQFFEELSGRGHEPTLARVTGRVRFDIVHGKHTRHWLVTIDRGDITVARKRGKADCTISADHDVFDRLALGQDNAMAATLRGALICAGDVDLMLAVQKLFPGPHADHAERNAG